MREEKGENTGKESTSINATKYPVAASVRSLKELGREETPSFGSQCKEKPSEPTDCRLGEEGGGA